MNKFLEREQIYDASKKAKELGNTIYSISRLNSYHTCQYAYYNTYVLGNRGHDGIYGLLGGCIHNHLENICNKVSTTEEMIKGFDEEFYNNTLFYSFPSEKVKDSWYADMSHFTRNFTPLEYDVTTERGFIVDIDNVLIQGYIDVMREEEDGITILDWKSSSQFKGDKLKDAGRQLVLYKIATEKITGKTVKRVGWYMLKYVDVHFDGKVKMCNRGSWVKDRSGVIKTQLKKMGYDNYEEMVEVAIQNNNLDNMPSEVQDRFVLEPCIVWYDITYELLQETRDYIKNTVSEIENKDHENYRLWNCKNLYKDKGFFCKNLCGYSDTCATYKSFAEKQL